jgi:signal transduction histidine kinase
MERKPVGRARAGMEPMGLHELAPKLRLYLGAHLLIIPFVLLGAATLPPAPNPWRLAVLVGAGLIACVWRLSLLGSDAKQSLLFATIVLALLIDGPAAAVVVAVLGPLGGLLKPAGTGQPFWKLVRSKTQPYQAWFNMANMGLAATISAAAWTWLPSPERSGFLDLLCRVAAFAVIFFLFNTLGVSIAVALDRAEPVLRCWTRDAAWVAPAYGLSAATALGLDWVYRKQGPTALVLVPAFYGLYAAYRYYLGSLRREVAHADEVQRYLDNEAEANQRKDEFLALLAHELRNPLGVIGNAQYLLRDREPLSPAGRKQVELIGREARKLGRLVDDLLDVSRITRGVVELRREVLDLGVAAANMLEGMQSAVSRRGHTLVFEGIPEPLYCDADPTRIEQVFLNLVDNAAKYTPPGGRIEVSLRREGEEAVFRVRDNGIGISPELLPHVFDLFVQADRSLAHSHGGLGIGLMLVKNLVEMHGGRVEAHSGGLGAGSEFVVRIPLLKDEGGGADPSSVIRHSSAVGAGAGSGEVHPSAFIPHPSKRVLVVDDNRDAAETLQEILAGWGHEVATVGDGTAALEWVEGHDVDLVLMDIGLPGIDGYEVARRIRQRGDLNGPVLVAVTGYGREEDRREAAAAGFEHHLVKPVHPEELRELLGRA